MSTRSTFDIHDACTPVQVSHGSCIDMCPRPGVAGGMARRTTRRLGPPVDVSLPRERLPTLGYVTADVIAKHLGVTEEHVKRHWRRYPFEIGRASCRERV